MRVTWWLSTGTTLGADIPCTKWQVEEQPESLRELLPARGDADSWQPPRGGCGPPEAATATRVVSHPSAAPIFSRTLISAGFAVLIVVCPFRLPQSGLSRAEDLCTVRTHPHCRAESAAGAVRRRCRRQPKGCDADGPNRDRVVEGVVKVLEVAQLAHPRGTLSRSGAMCMSVQEQPRHPAQETRQPTIWTPWTPPP